MKLIPIALLAWPALAGAAERNWFYGWSEDGTFYGSAWAGQDELVRPSLCLNDPKTPSPTWPKGVAAPDKSGCVVLCKDIASDCDSPDGIKKVLKLPPPSKAGPRGETVQLKIQKTKSVVKMIGTNAGATRTVEESNATVSVVREGRTLDSAVLELGEVERAPKVLDVYWREGGGAAAVLLGWSNGQNKLAMLEWQFKPAHAANARGMAHYRAREYWMAESDFLEAIAANPKHVNAHYNLACVHALQGDAPAALGELRWLKASDDAAAREKLRKAPGDPDLKSVIDQPVVRALLDGKPAPAIADEPPAGYKREGDVDVQSPKGTFLVRHYENEKDGHTQSWVVSASDPKQRARLPDDELPQDSRPYVLVSPDERFILAWAKREHGTNVMVRYRRATGLAFEPARVDAIVKRFFGEQLGLRDVGDEGIIEPLAWTDDGRGVVVSLRGELAGGIESSGWRCTLALDRLEPSLTDEQRRYNRKAIAVPK